MGTKIMGQNFVAILGHRLPLDDSILNVLPDMLAPTSAPRLAVAVQHLVTVGNARRAESARKYPSARLVSPLRADAPWVVEEPRRALYLNERGEAAPIDPPHWEERISEQIIRIHLAEPVGWQTVSVAERLAEDSEIEVTGPCSVSLDIYRRSLTVWSGARWGAFHGERSLHVAIRHVCRELARAFGSPIALYVSSYWKPVDELCIGACIEEIIAAMREAHGPPATTIESIYQKNENGTWSGDGYYIDTFVDLDDAE
ncbi:MAG TPA: hypothetical protein VFW96_05050 [Thermomicrobiales bacterium]|nr:hypothetical protein [Thermomicrobiales bacterium]